MEVNLIDVNEWVGPGGRGRGLGGKVLPSSFPRTTVRLKKHNTQKLIAANIRNSGVNLTVAMLLHS